MTLTDLYVTTATWEGAPCVGDQPVSLDMMALLFNVERNTPYTWSHREVLPPHDGVCGRSRWWWRSKIIQWYGTRNVIGGRPPREDHHQPMLELDSVA